VATTPPERWEDCTGTYLREALALDPATDAVRILELRREFLGAPAPAAAEKDDGEARAAAIRARESRALESTRTLLRRNPSAARFRSDAPAKTSDDESGGWVKWVILVLLAIRILGWIAKAS
jgi:hypothetical protein